MPELHDIPSPVAARAPRWRATAFAFLLAFATLFVLVAFVVHTLTRLEEPPPRGYLEEVRARILAETGVRAAIASLSERAQKEDVCDLRSDWTYKDFEDVDGNGRYDGEGKSGEPLVSRDAGPEYAVGVPLDQTRFPSFRAGEAIVDGRVVGVSGTLPDRGEPTHDTYALKVLDCASMIWVNGPLGPDGRLLDWLVRALDRLGSLRGAGPSLGERIRDGRPSGGFASKAQLRPILDADFDRVADLISVQAWVDPTTVNPACVRRPDFPLPEPRTFAAPWPWCAGDPLNDDGLRFGPASEGLESARAHPPQPVFSGMIEPRAPVDVNTACREVLVALLAGLEAETPELGKVTLSEDRAGALADDLLRRRGEAPFRSFGDVASFLEGLPYLSMEEKALVFANADPNTRLRGLNPSAARRRFAPLAKEDLTERGRSTEWCFGSMGYYDIESLGRVVRDGHLVARRCVHTVVRVHERVRLTTQYDFETRRRSSRGVRICPEHDADFPGLLATSSIGQEAPTAPCMADGHLELAPRPLRTEGCALAASFTGGLDADLALGDLTARGSARHGVSVLDASDPSDLLADGFCARDAYLRFAAMRNLPPNGTLELWVKPDWDAASVPAGPAATRTFLAVGDARGTGAGCVPAARMVLFFRDGQVNLYYGDTAGEAWGREVVWVESFPAAAGSGCFGKVGLPVDWRAGEWHHLCVVWEGERAWLLVDGVPAPGGAIVASEAPFAKGLGDRASIFLGANRFAHHRSNGWELPALATLGGMRIWESTHIPGREREGFPPPDRLPSGEGEVVLGLAREGESGGPGVLGTASWEWSAPSGTPPPEVTVLVDGKPKLLTQGEGEGVSLSSARFQSLSQVTVCVRLRPPPPPRRDAGAFDSLTVTVIHATPRYLSWWEE